jgi:ribonuclease BN (tRNA processing enzyme)
MKYYTLTLFLVWINFQLLAQTNNDALTATIIGSGSPKYNAERSGPSVLISYKNTKILVDMGNGTQANLDKLTIPTKQLNGLLFTHHHLDHNEEFVPIFIHCLLGGNAFTINGPEPTTTFVSSALTLYDKDIDYRLGKSGRTLNDVKNNFNCKDLKGGETFTIGDIKITSAKVNHTIYTVAYRFDAGEKSIVISGDLTYSESLPVLAKNTDYLIMDSGGSIELGASPKKRSRQ